MTAEITHAVLIFMRPSFFRCSSRRRHIIPKPTELEITPGGPPETFVTSVTTVAPSRSSFPTTPEGKTC